MTKTSLLDVILNVILQLLNHPMEPWGGHDCGFGSPAWVTAMRWDGYSKKEKSRKTLIEVMQVGSAEIGMGNMGIVWGGGILGGEHKDGGGEHGEGKYGDEKGEYGNGGYRDGGGEYREGGYGDGGVEYRKGGYMGWGRGIWEGGIWAGGGAYGAGGSSDGSSGAGGGIGKGYGLGPVPCRVALGLEGLAGGGGALRMGALGRVRVAGPRLANSLGNNRQSSLMTTITRSQWSCMTCSGMRLLRGQQERKGNCGRAGSEAHTAE
ncbi:hypothetical protein EDB89DRAFT_1917283 [Lactarius sanguifluus]|nr:hypothetical protein EDB89DRAFT_1917283 [Lactarius sanguifluus]